MIDDTGFTPAEVVRRVTTLGVIIDPVTVWRYLRIRLARELPAMAGAPLDRLPVPSATLDEWLDDFVDGVQTTRRRLTENLKRADSAGDVSPTNNATLSG